MREEGEWRLGNGEGGPTLSLVRHACNRSNTSDGPRLIVLPTDGFEAAPVCDAHGFRHHAGEGSLAGQMQRSSSRRLVLAVQVQLEGQPQNALQLLYLCLRLHINLQHSKCSAEEGV